MIPFRHTLDRIHMSISDLRFDRRSEGGYEVVMGYELWCDMVTDARAWGYVNPGPGRATVFGLPVEIDPRMPRGWIALRHEVVR